MHRGGVRPGATLWTILTTWMVVLLCLWGCTSSAPVIRVAFDPAWRPLLLQGLEPNLTSFSLDLMAEIATREGIRIEAIRSSGQNLLFNLDAGSFTAALTTAAPTPELETLFVFSDPVVFTGTSLVMRVNHPITSLENLKGLIIGVESNSEAFMVLTRIPGISFKQYNSPLEALEDCSAGHLDAVAMERLPAITFCRNAFKGQLTVYEEPLDLRPGIRFVAKRDDPLFPRILKGLRQTSPEALQKQWGLAI